MIFCVNRGESEASAKREWRARGGALKNPACPHTIVQALPAFIHERGYPIGYLTSRDPLTFLKFNMAVSVDEAIRESLRLFPNVPAVKEKQKKCIELLLKRKDVLGLLPTGFGKSLIYQLFPSVFETMNCKGAHVLVVSALKAISNEQMEELSDLGILEETTKKHGNFIM